MLAFGGLHGAAVSTRGVRGRRFVLCGRLRAIKPAAGSVVVGVVRGEERGLRPLRTRLSMSSDGKSATRAEVVSGNADARERVERVGHTADAESDESLEPVFRPRQQSAGARFVRSVRLFFRLRGRLKRGTVLSITMSGALPEASSAPSPLAVISGSVPIAEPTLQVVTESLRVAAHDPRIAAAYMRIGALACGYGKLKEVRRAMKYFTDSGKKLYAYCEAGGEKECYVAVGCSEFALAPEAFFALRGFRVGGSFLRGVLEKVGIEPQVERIGVYKSAGDQFARKSMAEPQREVLNALLDAQYKHFVADLAAARNLSEPDVAALLDKAPQSAQEYVDAGIATATLYEDEVLAKLQVEYQQSRSSTKKARADAASDAGQSASLLARAADDEGESMLHDKSDKKRSKSIRLVSARRYLRRSPAKLFGLDLGKGGEERGVVAIVRATGAISSGPSGRNGVGSDTIVKLLKRAERDDRVKAVVVRVDSPGGSALASDVMWHAVKEVRRKKPVIASMGDVAASGGYYLSMACEKIFAEELTLTGSIGVVTAKLSLGELYRRIGLAKENISKGTYAELDVDDRSFSPEEAEYFRLGAERAYLSFTSKAAASRGMELDALQKVAQGRVWTGRQAYERGLVDHLGGLRAAVSCAAKLAKLSDEPRVLELKSSTGFFSSLRGPSDTPPSASAAAAASLFSGAPLALSDIDIDMALDAPLNQMMRKHVILEIERLVKDSAPTGQATLARLLLSTIDGL